MIFFQNDYSTGAHPRILRALSDTNMIPTEGYSEDEFCAEARQILQQRLECPDADIHFLSGGTQTNLTAICAFLRPHEAVLAAETAHINVHETGAIEASGHKICCLSSADGKLTAAQAESLVSLHTDEHMVKPKMIYISNSTEVGTVYTKSDLTALREVCDRHGMYLYMDGARLGAALTCAENDLTLSDIARLTDAFYIGGTKNGALLGEALVLLNPRLKEDFRFIIKQRGGMLAKGRLFGVQFAELFKDDLFFAMARHANEMAALLREGLKGGGYRFLADSPTNQVFPILPDRVADHLREKFVFSDWQKIDERSTAIRLVTSWSTTEEEVMEFLHSL